MIKAENTLHSFWGKTILTFMLEAHSFCCYYKNVYKASEENWCAVTVDVFVYEFDSLVKTGYIKIQVSFSFFEMEHMTVGEIL